jgi:hypothetical protein
MKKSILALVALLGTGAVSWAQTTTTTGTGTNSTTTGTTTTNSTSSPGSNTSTNTNTNTSTGTDLNGSSTNNGTNSLNTTSGNMGNTTTPSYPSNANTTGTLQNSTSGVDYNSRLGDTTILQSSGNYAAYGAATNVPSNLQTNLQTTYPSAFSPTWEQRGDWYRASFNNMNRNMQVYYAPNGDSYTVALPVTQSFVPEEIVTKALGMYGNNIYSINRVRAANNVDAYQVTILENGISRTEFIGEDGATVAAIDVFRNDGAEMNSSSSNAANADMNNTNVNTSVDNGNMNNSNMNNGNMNSNNMNSMDANNSNMTTPVTDPNVKYKHKIKSQDGNNMKIKTKNGKTRVKGNDVNANGTTGGM